KFDLGDFLEQLRMIRKMGPLDQLMKMIPGMDQAIGKADLDDYELTRTEAIISSMTMTERSKPGIINASRKRRIARGSGTQVADVNRLLKNFLKSRKMMKHMGKLKKGAGSLPSFPGMNFGGG
ncbi:MAG: signal recognition particle protein, partial [Nitrospinota bacterium]|nr:signal recognition particle protein [Nitrospinota bacterium]